MELVLTLRHQYTINALPGRDHFLSGSPYCATGTATLHKQERRWVTYSALLQELSSMLLQVHIDLQQVFLVLIRLLISFTVGACSNTATSSITITALPIATISLYRITILCNWQLQL